MIKFKTLSEAINSLKKRSKYSKMHSEEGFTLVEIMVAITLFAVVGALITTTILRLGETTQKFTTTINSQNDAAETSILINRNIGSASRILIAEDYSITIRSVLDGHSYDISVFYYNPATGNNAPINVPTENIPVGSIVQSGLETGDPPYLMAAFVIVDNYDPSLDTLPLFTYYNASNTRMLAPLTAGQRGLIEKVSHQFTISIAERAKPIYIHSAIAPRLML